MMEPEAVRAAIEKLQYQVRLLGEAIDYKAHPIEALIMQMDWGAGHIDRVHDIFETWDKRIASGGEMDSHRFESDLSGLDIDYRTLKSVMLTFYRNGQWMKVCEAYVDSFGDAPSLEYHGILKRERN